MRMERLAIGSTFIDAFNTMSSDAGSFREFCRTCLNWTQCSVEDHLNVLYDNSAELYVVVRNKSAVAI